MAADGDSIVIFVPVTGVGIQVWRNGATLSAFPNPVPVTGAAEGATTLIWNVSNAQFIEILVGTPTGPLFADGGNRGSATTPTWVTDGMTFYVQDVSGGIPASASNTVATLVVHLLKM